MIPVAMELDLKRLPLRLGEKSVHMVKSKELLGYYRLVHGGCSPLGMKGLLPLPSMKRRHYSIAFIFR